jgi:hypothetical protein
MLKSFRVAVAISGVLALLSPLSSQAQLRFSAKSLTTPTAAKMCRPAGDINESGDAAVVCSFAAGTRRVLWYRIGLIGLYRNETWYTDKVVYWPASGGSRVLDQADKLSINFISLNGAGAIYSRLLPLNSTGYTYDTTWIYAWPAPAGRGARYQPPAGPALPLSDFVKRPGDVLAVIDSAGDRWTVSPQGGLTRQPTDMPPPSSSPLIGQYIQHYAPASGKRVISRTLATGSTDVTKDRYTEYWFGDGRTWQLIKTPDGALAQDIWGMNDSGTIVALDTSGKVFTWDPATGTTTYLPGASQPLSSLMINDQGLVAGTFYDDAASRNRVLAWWQGQLMNLDNVTTLPTNMTLARVLSINNRNQLLVWADDKTRANTGRNMLLTPQ